GPARQCGSGGGGHHSSSALPATRGGPLGPADHGGDRVSERARLPVHGRERRGRDTDLFRRGRVDRHLKTRRRPVRHLSAALAAVIVALPLLARAQAESPPAEPQASPAVETAPASAPARPAPLGMRIFSLHYKKIDDVYLLISPYVGPRGSVKTQPAQRTLTVQDAPENLNRIAALIGSYDVPPKN